MAKIVEKRRVQLWKKDTLVHLLLNGTMAVSPLNAAF